MGLDYHHAFLIVAVTLARGAVRMAREQVIVKHLAAIQNLGSMRCAQATPRATRVISDRMPLPSYSP